MTTTALESPAPCESGGTVGAGLPCVIGQNDGADIDGDMSQRLPMPIADTFVTDILRPYRLQARYLKSATITQFSREAGRPDSSASIVTGGGTFSIPESCYIDDTGHFNAVEFNICYNQLAYVVFGKCIEAGLIHPLWSENTSPLSVDEYKDDQLPSMLIVRIDKMRFLKQMKSDDFAGELKINRMTQLGSTWFFFTSITFYDDEGVKAQGSVVLAYSRSLKPN
jgi:hypothetical protein